MPTHCSHDDAKLMVAVTKVQCIQFKLAIGFALSDTPAVDKYVVIAAPHTSNWDLFYMLAFAAHFDVKPRFMAKHSVFVGPAGTVLRRLGGIPIERHHRRDVVKQMVDLFAASESMAFAWAVVSQNSYWSS